jgi:catechol 2,3-dioxygenase-like lactoylglutathione lyase family enzyme
MSTSEAKKASNVPDAPRPTKLAHVVLKTHRFEEMLNWYGLVLNASITAETESSPRLGFLTFDEEHHRVALVEEPGEPPASVSSPLEHIAFTFGSLGDLVATYERLSSQGVEPFWPVHHGGVISFYYYDPDGNRIELGCDAMTLEEAVEFMKSEHFVENPIGVIFDPKQMVARFKEGGAEEILRPMPLPPGKSAMDMLR